MNDDFGKAMFLYGSKKLVRIQARGMGFELPEDFILPVRVIEYSDGTFELDGFGEEYAKSSKGGFRGEIHTLV